MSVTAAAPSRSKKRDELARALRRNGIPRDPDLHQPLPKRLLKSKFFWLSVVMILVYLTMLVLLYQKVVPDREVPGGDASRRRHRSNPDRAEVRRGYGDPTVIAVLVGRPIPAAALLGMADDVRLGRLRRHLSSRLQINTLGGQPSQHRR